MLKLGKICTWNEIEINEPFAYDGCITLSIKINNELHMPFANDEGEWDGVNRGSCYLGGTGLEKYIKETYNGHLYKLPKSVQKLWMEE